MTIPERDSSSSRSPLRLPELYPLQRAAVYDRNRISCIEASTKSGKTVGCLVWLIDRAWTQGRPGREYWWIAPSYQQADIAGRRARTGLRSVPGARYRRSPIVVELPGGSRLRFLSGDRPDNLYGEDVHGAVIDEASRVRAEAWHAIRSTVTATRAPVRMIANVTDRTNWFYRLCRRAESGEPGYGFHRITSDDAVAAGILDASEIEQARSDLPEHVFDALYRCIAPEAGINPFGSEAEIRANIRPTAGKPEFFGWDLARDRNWTAGVGLDAEGRCAAFHRWHGLSWHDQIPRIAKATGEAIGVADATGPGSMPVEALQDATEGAIEPFLFTAASKQRIMEGLAVAIQRGEITYPDGPLVDELLHFEYELTRAGVRYSAPAGMHDDCVDALAMAHHLRATWTHHRVSAGFVH